MSCRLFPDPKATEKKIVELFFKNQLHLNQGSYRRENSVWGEIAYLLSANNIKTRKWLYHIWKEDRRKLRTKALQFSLDFSSYDEFPHVENIDKSGLSQNSNESIIKDTGVEDDRLYCLCKQKNNPDEPYAQCSQCKDWFHPLCVGYKSITDIQVISPWLCPLCKPKKQKIIKKKKKLAPRNILDIYDIKTAHGEQEINKTEVVTQSKYIPFDVSDEVENVSVTKDNRGVSLESELRATESMQLQPQEECSNTNSAINQEKSLFLNIFKKDTIQSMTKADQLSMKEFITEACPSNFTISLSPEEWNKIKPEHRTGYRVLKDGWTETICNKIKKINKFCILTFKYNRVRQARSRKRNCVYWRARGQCKFAGCTEYNIILTQKPSKKHCQVFMSVDVNGSINHKRTQTFKRHTRGEERDILKAQLREMRPMLLHTKKLANADMEQLIAGNMDEIKSIDVLQKISSENNLENRLDTNEYLNCLLVQKKMDEEEIHMIATKHAYIQHIGMRPFVLQMYSESQLHMLKDLQDARQCFLYLDATGSVVMKPKDIQNKILYYTLCLSLTSETRSTIPVAEMLSSDQSTPTILHWLSCLCRDFFKVCKRKLSPQKVEIDFSWALIHAATQTFNQNNIMDYLKKCLLVCERKMLCNFTILHICAAHMIKLVSIKLSNLKTSKATKQFFLYSFALLQNASSLGEIEIQLFRMTYVFSVQKETNAYKKNIAELNEAISTQKIEGMENITETTTNEDFIDNDPNEEGNIKRGSPFSKKFSKMFTQTKTTADDDDDDSATAADNLLYCPALIPLLQSYAATIPLWSGIMLKNLSLRKTRDTNATVENWFRTTKKVILNDRLHRRAGDFVQCMYEFLQGRVREIGLKYFRSVQNLETEKYQTDRPQEENLTQLEKWQKRKEVGKSKKAKYYQPPTPKNTKPVAQANCPAWSGKGKIGKKKIILRNTCTIDNLLFIIHMAIRKYDWLLTELDSLKTEDSSISTFLKVHQHFLRKDWNKGKIEWLKHLNRFQGQTVWDAYGSEEDFVVCRLNYLLTTTVESICNGPFCPDPVNIRYTNLIEICCEDLGNIQTVLNAWTDEYISNCKRKRGTSTCDGLRTFSRREFKHGLPCMLFVTVVKKPRNNPLTCPSNHTTLPSVVTVSGRSYKPVAVTYNVGEHFVCFFKLTSDESWHCYDGIKEFKHPGKGIETSSTQLTKEVLVPGVTVGHVIMVRLDDSSLNIVQEPAILKDMIAAQKWVEDHKHTFAGQVFIPSLLSMTKSNAEDCIKNYQNDQNFDNEADDCRQHFIFTFTEKDDMEEFLRETRDKQQLLVHTKLRE